MKTDTRITVASLILLLPMLAACAPREQATDTAAPRVSFSSWFPWEESLRHDRDFEPTGALERISESVYRLQDCSNVYIVERDNRALLVGFGSGEVLDRLDETGARGVDLVLATHHHRNQVQGLVGLGQRDFELVVPAAEAEHFEDTESFWRDVKIYINYDCRSHWNTLRESVPVDRKVSGGDVVTWRGIDFAVIETPGVTEGAVSYVADIDGRRVVFTGDLIAGRGKVHNWFDLHWDYYGFTQGIDASGESFERIREVNPDLLLPAHGGPVEDPEAAMRANSAVYDTLRGMLVPNEQHREMHRVREILPHLAFVGKNCYAIISDNGTAFLYDYGYVNRQDLWEFQDRFDVDRIDVVSFSHYHDDHNIRTYELKHHGDPEVWVFETMREVFGQPFNFKLPCLIPFPIRAERVVRDGEKIRWNEYELEFFHMPGQTYYHTGLVTVIDGKKVMFTGDNTWKKKFPDERRNGPVVPHNVYFLDGGFITCARKMLEHMPDIVCPAHTEEYSPTRPDLEEFLGWAGDLRTVMTGLIDQPDPNFGMDYQWCRIHPYRSVPEDGEPVSLTVKLRNHLFKDAEVTVDLRCPEGMLCDPPSRTFTVPAKQEADIPFTIMVPPGMTGRHVVTADVTINGARIGEYAEGLIDL